MTDPCYILREKVTRLGKRLSLSSLINSNWNDSTVLTKEEIHKLAESIDKAHEIDEEFKQAVLELSDCIKRFD